MIEWLATNTTPRLDMEESPPMMLDMDTNPLADADGKAQQPHRFSDDHLQLVFDMR
jgi:hypothetical protein